MISELTILSFLENMFENILLSIISRARVSTSQSNHSMRSAGRFKILARGVISI
jgi:hypothetical protein